MTVPDEGREWRKSTASAPDGDCVEVDVKFFTAMRDSKNPDDVLPLPVAAMRAFLEQFGH